MEKMRKFSENTGHRENGEWINETHKAMRNQLGILDFSEYIIRRKIR